MKVWNICLYVAIFCLSCSVMVDLAPYIFPDAADWISQSIPSAGALQESINEFRKALGLVGESPDFITGFGAIIETVVVGFQVVGQFFYSTILIIPQLMSFFGLPAVAQGIVSIFVTILYLMLGVAFVQLVTGRYFINVE